MTTIQKRRADHSHQPAQRRTPPPKTAPAGRPEGRHRPNLLGSALGWLWLVVIIVPLYYVVITSFKDQRGFFDSNPLLPAGSPTLDNYVLVLRNDFARYFFNSVAVAVGTVVPAVLLSFMAAYGIVRSRGRTAGATNTLFILGLSIPLQATAVPLYYLITRLNLYDSLLALVLPSIAFSIPVSVLVLSNFLRDVPKELFESMRLDGCSEWQIMWRLALPLTRPAVTTVAIYNTLNNWNAFLLPLILTQSPERRTLPLSLWTYQDEFTVNTPALLAAIVLSALPLVVLYVFGQKQLVSGISSGFGK
ncbi:raffinose/stachyose/melibiose transport system permease protein [Streptomyces sp. SAI-149]|uniref:carbohydrate ABC transporter permease n=1 Tax=unclassified Streptomyces TaxID=2593676 RepID=UPI00247E3BA6|nr:raffinose/stachyose/melibiose transport system permease protein [Streptomyces sp. SAI-119]MDH6499588.1 raffinose/stachyose/melibiose transport system permease protein [Streptomyces sp. SAI-149]